MDGEAPSGDITEIPSEALLQRPGRRDPARFGWKRLHEKGKKQRQQEKQGPGGEGREGKEEEVMTMMTVWMAKHNDDDVLTSAQAGPGSGWCRADAAK